MAQVSQELGFRLIRNLKRTTKKYETEVFNSLNNPRHVRKTLRFDTDIN